MNLLLTIRIALRAFGKNKMRAGLTCWASSSGVGGRDYHGLDRPGGQRPCAGPVFQSGTNVVVVIPGIEMSGGGVRRDLRRL